MKNLIELHCHLDGSLDLKTSYKLAMNRGIIDKDMEFEDFKKRMTVSSDNASLEEFLSCFELPISILQDEEALTISTTKLIKNLRKDKVVYAEIRFAPQFHTQEGLTQEEAVKAVLEGVKDARSLHKDIKVQIILCMMTDDPAGKNFNENKETIEVAKKFLKKGVCAIDLAGNEANLADYKELIDYAKELGVPYVLHAGEVDFPKNVELAIEYGAKRIGHGVNVVNDEEILKKLVDSKVPLEVCVTSNIQCKTQPSYEEHSIRELFDKGVKITLNTDNRTLSNTTLNKEIKKIMKHLNFTKKEVRKMMINALNNSFLNEKDKDRILDKF